MSHLPDIDKAFSLVLQQEREMELTVVTDSTEPAPTALHMNSQNPHNGNGNQFNKLKWFNPHQKGP